MSKVMCEWCEALDKSPEDFHDGDLVTWDMVQHTYWGDGKWYYQKAVYCPMCGRSLSKRTESEMTLAEAESVLQFAENGMRVSETAQHMFIHRNTLIYRLDKIKRVTGLDPYWFYDLYRLVPLARGVLGKARSEERKDLL